MKKKLIISIASAVASAIIYHYVNKIIENIADEIDVDKKFNYEYDDVQELS